MTKNEAIRRIKIVFKCMNCPEDKQCYDSNLRPMCEYYADKEKLRLSDALNKAIESLEEESKTEQWIKTLKSIMDQAVVWHCPQCGAKMIISNTVEVLNKKDPMDEAWEAVRKRILKEGD